MAVLLETSEGDIVIDLYVELAPRSSLNFLKLCKIKYYNNAPLFRIQRDFAVSCGHLDRDVSIHGCLGGEDYITDEFHPMLRHNKKGTISAANRAPHMTASHVIPIQFFITVSSSVKEFDDVHPVFGCIGEGFDVLDKINKAIVDSSGRPYKYIHIKHTYILEDPFEDPPQLIVPSSPPPLEESDRLLEKDLVETDKNTLQVNETIKENEAKTKAIVLEMLGDIPDAYIRPPDNVAFICKLNKVTTDEDLYMIFSKFGSVKSCKVVRDNLTAESLQYAFIEFENPRDCEEAILKMQGALIDERRIHIDFSQSVAKLWKKYRRGKPAKYYQSRERSRSRERSQSR